MKTSQINAWVFYLAGGVGGAMLPEVFRIPPFWGFVLGFVVTWFVLEARAGFAAARQNYADDGKSEWEGY